MGEAEMREACSALVTEIHGVKLYPFQLGIVSLAPTRWASIKRKANRLRRALAAPPPGGDGARLGTNEGEG